MLGYGSIALLTIELFWCSKAYYSNSIIINTRNFIKTVIPICWFENIFFSAYFGTEIS
jgi:hypothetical protein